MKPIKAEAIPKTVRTWHSQSGRSVVEILAVVTIATIMTAVALPQVIGLRRMIRSAALPREIASQLRLARQRAMAQRQAITVQYDDSTKTLTIFDHNNVNNATPACNMSGTALFGVSGFPATTCSTVVLTTPISGNSGLPLNEVAYGVPASISSPTLGDTTTPTALASSKVSVTFQTDGSVLDGNGNPVNKALFFYNTVTPQQTSCAISILGSAGRIKIWRYDTSGSTYAE